MQENNLDKEVLEINELLKELDDLGKVHDDYRFSEPRYEETGGYLHGSSLSELVMGVNIGIGVLLGFLAIVYGLFWVMDQSIQDPEFGWKIGITLVILWILLTIRSVIQLKYKERKKDE